VIVDSHQLADFLPALRAAEWIALDTEADSRHAYPEKLCLVQISIVGADVLIDPLAKLDLTPLWDTLRGRELILHGSDYDLRLLSSQQNFRPHAVFDTMIAARLTGCEKFGLGDLVQKFIGVTLEKASQKADWGRRPLTEKMIDYARSDTRHLKPLVNLLHQQLVEKGRLVWLEESCARLVAEATQPVPPDHDGEWRLKGSNRLAPPALAVLRELWHWREKEAVANNRPPYFVMAHEALMAVAERAVAGVDYEPLVPFRMPDRRKQRLRESVLRGLEVPAVEQPQPVRGEIVRWTVAQKKRFEALEQRRNRVASQLKIDPTLIASKATLGELIREEGGNGEFLMRWQRELLFG